MSARFVGVVRAWALGALGALCVGASAATPYTLPTPMSRPGFLAVQPWDVNDAGVVVGASDAEAFVLEAGDLRSLALPFVHARAIATGISNQGLIVGTYYDAQESAQGFLYEDGTYSTYSVASGSNTSIRHVSSDGRFISGTFSGSGGWMHGFVLDRWTGAFTDVFTPGTLTIAQGVNIHGQVVGSYSAASGRGAFVLDTVSGQRTDHATLGGLDRVFFRDINDSGLIAGSLGSRAFVGVVDDLYLFPDEAGVDVSFGYGLNNRGDLVGFSENFADGSLLGWVAAPVPEPHALALWILGALAMLTRRQRRSRF
ncbi:MAG: hypothetical protein KBC73_03550 [Burkholderiaceae bacterium]|nr:hypothetical protein [Burkholderiaceae bacterium]